ncbi:hypothetical protein F4679DRAFT_579821 [Xylaria curta]|nr:hypothetical protein F4679DRAFT_579821 [Xylaria curta]
MDNALRASHDAQSPYLVYTGLWTNWSYGNIMGATLTLPQSSANLLIVIVALFVALTTGYLWRFRQVLLRNNASAASSAFTMIELVWMYRKRGARRLLPLLAWTLLLAVLLALASGFSSRVAVSNEVLVAGSNCGFIAAVDPNLNFTVQATQLTPYESDFLTAASIRATQCYENTSTLTTDCGTYIKPRLSLSTDRNASCPFGNLCHNSYGNLLLDTGFHNSHEDLGLNAPVGQRFLRRIVTHCATLKLDGYQASLNLSEDRTYITTYSYSKDTERNYIYLVPNYAYAEEATAPSPLISARYQIGALDAIFEDGELASSMSAFNPIAELTHSGGDIYLFYLSANGVLFTNKTLDPWYQAAHVVGRIGRAKSDGTTDKRLLVFGQDNPGSLLACSQKFQWCALNSTGGSHCTPLGTYLDAYKSALGILTTQITREQVDWIFARLELSPTDVVSRMGTESLLSRRLLGIGVQAALPENQWQLEVEHWYHIVLAGYQKIYMDGAAGPPPSYPEEWKAISTAHLSFSVFGLSFLLVAGLLIILLSIFIEPVARFVQTRGKLSPYSRLEWNTNGVFQLQRLAHEELGIGEWTAADKTIPETKTPASLASLDVSDLEHPRLLRQPSKERTPRPSRPPSSQTDAPPEESTMMGLDSLDTNAL